LRRPDAPPAVDASTAPKQQPRRAKAKKVVVFSDDSDTDAQIRALIEKIESETI